MPNRPTLPAAFIAEVGEVDSICKIATAPAELYHMLGHLAANENPGVLAS